MFRKSNGQARAYEIVCKAAADLLTSTEPVTRAMQRVQDGLPLEANEMMHAIKNTKPTETVADVLEQH